MIAAAAPREGAGALFARLRGRPDSEHEMSFNRVALGTGIFVYAKAIGAPPVSIAVLIGYVLLAVAILIHISADARKRPVRRVLVMLLDMLALGHVMHANGDATSALYPVYLWCILGNGFRFGVRYLYLGVAMGVISFGGVICTTDFWWDASFLSVGLLLGLIALPLYAATLIHKLSKATAAAEEASRAKSYFLASVSHELRTPLTAIIGLGAHLQSSETDGERRQMADTIVSAGRSLLSMINRLLDYSRIEARGVVAESRPFDLPRLLVAVRELMRFQAAEKGLAINLHLTPGTPLTLAGDETHLRDILVNLVGNAVKFTQDGAITIIAGTERGAAGEPMLRLTVADTGMGISADAQAHIFGSFRQADDTIIDRFGGTGLGLAICKQLAILMGGEIGVDSRVGEGSRFWVTVRVEETDEPPATPCRDARLLLYSDDPALAEAIGRGVVRRDTRQGIRDLYDRSVVSIVLADARLVAAHGLIPLDLARSLSLGGVVVLLADEGDALPEPLLIERGFATVAPRSVDAATLDRTIAIARALAGDASGPLPDAAPAQARTPLRVLAADDNQMNRKVFEMILGRAGHDVVCVDDGEQALDLMKDHSFDIVLMDVNMPVLNGVEATKLYRFAALGQRHVPIVGVTADASPATAERCLGAGMDACIAKPVEADELLDMIERLTGNADAPEVPLVPAFDPAGVVTPLFRPAPAAASEEPAVDWCSLEELEELGGRDFVVDLLDVYLKDADTLLRDVTRSIEEGDAAAFRSNTHALRSSAANVGARRLAEMCLHYQRLGEDEFVTRGARHRDALAAELARVAEALGRRPEWRAAG